MTAQIAIAEQQYATTYGERGADMREQLMTGAGHMADALASGLTVSAAWEYVRDMAGYAEERIAGAYRMTYAEAKAKRETIRAKHGITEWGLGAATRNGERKLTP